MARIFLLLICKVNSRLALPCSDTYITVTWLSAAGRAAGEASRYGFIFLTIFEKFKKSVLLNRIIKK